MRKKTANKEDISYELQTKLFDKYGLKLSADISLILVNEMVTILKVMILSRYYDKINLDTLGCFKFKLKPRRFLSGNIPNTKGKMLELPERYQLTFTPTEAIQKKIKNF